jgi:DNA-binding GntR family transcriptional regulator
MARRTQSVASLAISLDRRSSQPLYRQIYRQLREIILAGRVGAGALLTRELGVSRITLELAFDQLRADGYIEGRIGSGTYAAGLPLNSPDNHRAFWRRLAQCPVSYPSRGISRCRRATSAPRSSETLP